MSCNNESIWLYDFLFNSMSTVTIRYTDFWLSEHHPGLNLNSSSPNCTKVYSSSKSISKPELSCTALLESPLGGNHGCNFSQVWSGCQGGMGAQSAGRCGGGPCSSGPDPSVGGLVHLWAFHLGLSFLWYGNDPDWQTGNYPDHHSPPAALCRAGERDFPLKSGTWQWTSANTQIMTFQKSPRP